MNKREQYIKEILDLQDVIQDLIDKHSDFYTINDYDLINSDINSYMEEDFEMFESDAELEDYIKYLKELINKGEDKQDDETTQEQHN